MKQMLKSEYFVLSLGMVSMIVTACGQNANITKRPAWNSFRR